MIDYKLFLNQAIKALSQDDFDNETFIIDLFWKAKFHQTETSAPIEQFNQAFYQYFNKEHKLLSIEYVEQITNECFGYLLRKNRKQISKRNFRKVARRHFKDIFNLIIFNFKPQPLSTTGKQMTQGSGYIQTTCYPDSLDTRSQHRSNGSKSLYETSTFHNMNIRSKSSHNISSSGGGHQQSINDNTNLVGISIQDTLAQKIGLLSDRKFDSRVQGCRLLCYSLEKVGQQFSGRTVLQAIKAFSRQNQQENVFLQKHTHPNSANKQTSVALKSKHNSKKRVEKENMIPHQHLQQQSKESQYYDSINNYDFMKMEQTVQSSLDERVRNPLQERQTFSFSNGNYQSIQSNGRTLSGGKGPYKEDPPRIVSTIEQVRPSTRIGIKERKLQRIIDLEDQYQQPYGCYDEVRSIGGGQNGENLATLLNQIHTNSLQYSVTPSNSNKPSHALLFSQDRYSSQNYEDLMRANSTTTNLRKSLKCETQRQDLMRMNPQSASNTDLSNRNPNKVTTTIGEFQHGQVDLESEDEQLFSDQVFSDQLLSDQIHSNQNCSGNNMLSENNKLNHNVSISNNDNSLRELEQRLEDIKSSNPHSVGGKSTRRYSQNPIPKKKPSAQSQMRKSAQLSHPARTYSQLQLNEHNLNNPSMILGSCDIAQRQTTIQHSYGQYIQPPSASHSGIDQHSQISEIPCPNQNPRNNSVSQRKNQQFEFEERNEVQQQNHYQPSSLYSYENAPHVLSIISNQHSQAAQKHVNTIQHQTVEAPGKYHKPKELVYFEKKYKKSKEKLRKVIHESVTEKTKNQALEQCNQVLQERFEQMAQANYQIEQALIQRDDLSRHLQGQLRQVEYQVAVRLISKLQDERVNQTLRATLRKWKDECFRQQAKDFNLQKISQLIRHRQLNRFYQLWVRYKIDRQTRKEKRKMLKTQVKVLKMLFRRKQLADKRRAFSSWKGPALRAYIIDEVQKDIKFAHDQVKAMRFILSFNKLEMILSKKLFKQKATVFLTFTLLTQQLAGQPLQNNHNSHLNSAFNSKQNQVHNYAYQPNSHISNYQQNVPITSAGFNSQATTTLYPPPIRTPALNLTSSYHSQKTVKHIPARGQSCENRSILISPQPRSISPFDCNQDFKTRESEKRVVNQSAEFGRFESQRKRDKERQDSQPSANDFSAKMNRQRQQAHYLEGIEKIYQFNRKFITKLKSDYLARWKAVAEQMLYENMNFSPRQGLACDSSGTDFLDNSNENALATANFQDNQTTPVSQPCYYKTNEGFFYPNQQANKIKLKASPNRATTPAGGSSATSSNQILQRQNLTVNSSISQLAPSHVIPKPYPLTKAPTQNRLDKSNSNRSSKKTLRAVSQNPQRPRENTAVNDSALSSQLADMSNVSSTNQELSEAIAYLKTKVTTLKPLVGVHPSLS